MDKLKYFLEYDNIENIVSRLEIWEKGYLGEPTEINGQVILNYAERKDLLQALIPSNLDITLEADEDITLQDLYTEEENKFKAKFFIGGQLVFFGILKPDGIWEDWVTDKWEMSIDAMDGLSILKELSFVKDDGKFYGGKISQFEALKQCLHRIGYDLPINISNDLPTYNGLTSTNSILHNVLMNADRFCQDKKTNAIMDCEEVLKSILEPYNASIFQMNGEWWVIRANDVKASITFKRYDGVDLVTTVEITPTINIGSQIDNYEIHHINANQKKSVNPSAQAFRVNYKYGLVRVLNENPDLIMGSGLSSDGWNFQSIGGEVKNDGNGILIEEKIENAGPPLFPLKTDLLVASNPGIEASIGDNIVVEFKYDFEYIYKNGPDARTHKFYYRFSTNNYFLTSNGWELKSGLTGYQGVLKQFDTPVGIITDAVTLLPIPEDGTLKVELLINYLDVGVKSVTNQIFKLKEIKIYPSENNNLKGEFHTAQRNSRISSVTKNDKTVSIGDSISDIYLGTIYNFAGVAIQFWNRSGLTENKPLLRLMVEDTLRISPRPMLYFEGDVYGYFNYLSLVFINNVSGKYQISKYSYNSQSNINRTSFKEFSTDLLPTSDYRYEFEYDYGQETKVVIRE